MTPVRPFPQDTPKRTTTWRRGVIRAVQTAVGDGWSYVVDFDDVGTEMAFSRNLWPVNTRIAARWRNESALWWIDGGEQAFFGYPIIYTNYSEANVAQGKDNGRLAVRDWIFIGNNAYLTKQWPDPRIEYEEISPNASPGVRLGSVRVNPTTWGFPAKGYNAYDLAPAPGSSLGGLQAVESIDWVNGDGSPPLPGGNAGWGRGGGTGTGVGSFHPGQDFHPDGNSFVAIDYTVATFPNRGGLIVMPCPFFPGTIYGVFGISTVVSAVNPDGIVTTGTSNDYVGNLFGAVRWSHNGNLIAVGMATGPRSDPSLPSYQAATYRYTQQTTLRDIWVDANGMYRREYPIPPPSGAGSTGQTLDFAAKINLKKTTLGNPTGLDSAGSNANTLAWTPDDRWLIIGRSADNNHESALCAQRIDTDGTPIGEPVYFGENPADLGVLGVSADSIGAVEFHPDGRTLAVSIGAFANFEGYGNVFLCTFDDGVWGPAFAWTFSGQYRGPLLWVTPEHLCHGLQVMRYKATNPIFSVMNRIVADFEPPGFSIDFGPTNIAVWPVLRPIQPDRLEGLGLID